VGQNLSFLISIQEYLFPATFEFHLLEPTLVGCWLVVLGLTDQRQRHWQLKREEGGGDRCQQHSGLKQTHLWLFPISLDQGSFYLVASWNPLGSFKYPDSPLPQPRPIPSGSLRRVGTQTSVCLTAPQAMPMCPQV
jgi:hypothetical protein